MATATHSGDCEAPGHPLLSLPYLLSGPHWSSISDALQKAVSSYDNPTDSTAPYLCLTLLARVLHLCEEPLKRREIFVRMCMVLNTAPLACETATVWGCVVELVRCRPGELWDDFRMSFPADTWRFALRNCARFVNLEAKQTPINEKTQSEIAVRSILSAARLRDSWHLSRFVAQMSQDLRTVADFSREPENSVLFPLLQAWPSRGGVDQSSLENVAVCLLSFFSAEDGRKALAMTERPARVALGVAQGGSLACVFAYCMLVVGGSRLFESISDIPEALVPTLSCITALPPRSSQQIGPLVNALLASLAPLPHPAPLVQSYRAFLPSLCQSVAVGLVHAGVGAADEAANRFLIEVAAPWGSMAGGAAPDLGRAAFLGLGAVFKGVVGSGQLSRSRGVPALLKSVLELEEYRCHSEDLDAVVAVALDFLGPETIAVIALEIAASRSAGSSLTAAIMRTTCLWLAQRGASGPQLMAAEILGKPTVAGGHVQDLILRALRSQVTPTIEGAYSAVEALGGDILDAAGFMDFLRLSAGTGSVGEGFGRALSACVRGNTAEMVISSTLETFERIQESCVPSFFGAFVFALRDIAPTQGGVVSLCPPRVTLLASNNHPIASALTDQLVLQVTRHYPYASKSTVLSWWQRTTLGDQRYVSAAL